MISSKPQQTASVNGSSDKNNKFTMTTTNASAFTHYHPRSSHSDNCLPRRVTTTTTSAPFLVPFTLNRSAPSVPSSPQQQQQNGHSNSRSKTSAKESWRQQRSSSTATTTTTTARSSSSPAIPFVSSDYSDDPQPSVIVDNCNEEQQQQQQPVFIFPVSSSSSRTLRVINLQPVFSELTKITYWKPPGYSADLFLYRYTDGRSSRSVSYNDIPPEHRLPGVASHVAFRAMLEASIYRGMARAVRDFRASTFQQTGKALTKREAKRLEELEHDLWLRYTIPMKDVEIHIEIEHLPNSYHRYPSLAEPTFTLRMFTCIHRKADGITWVFYRKIQPEQCFTFYLIPAFIFSNKDAPMSLLYSN